MPKKIIEFRIFQRCARLIFIFAPMLLSAIKTTSAARLPEGSGELALPEKSLLGDVAAPVEGVLSEALTGDNGADAQAEALAEEHAVPLSILPGGEAGIEPAQNDGPSLSAARLFDGDELARYRAPEGVDGRVDLSRFDPADTRGLSKEQALRMFSDDRQVMTALQPVFYADGRNKMLAGFQALDSAGKTETPRAVLRGMNLDGLFIHNFKKPTDMEASHHFLWRMRRALDAALASPFGTITIFDRTHYEDILVPSVYGTLSPEAIEKRYQEINAFEKELAGRGVSIMKFYLHMSKAEQGERLRERLTDPAKHWKFSRADLLTRERWSEFLSAYERILALTNTPWAPWYIIPSDNPWFREFLVGRIFRRKMESFDSRYPPRPAYFDDIIIGD